MFGLEPWAIVAITLAIGLLGVIAIETVLIPQQADAAGCPPGPAINASKGRCFRP